MPLDLSRLESVCERGGKITARCPACADTDADKAGNHLVIYSDGRFGCVMHPGEGPQSSEHRKRVFEIAGIPSQDAPRHSPPVHSRSTATTKQAVPLPDWRKCCDRLAGDNGALQRLAQWRGWTVDFCHSVAVAGEIGLHEGNIVFPVRDDEGRCTGLHVFAWPDSVGTKAWYVSGRNLPLIIGAQSTAGAREANVFESQWDAFTILHAKGWKGESLEKPFVVTRGTSVNPALSALLDGVESVVLWTQNDEPKKNGARPSEEWLARAAAQARNGNATVWRVEPPPQVKDWNDYLHAQNLGATLTAAKEARLNARVVISAATIEGINGAPEPEFPTPEPLPESLPPVAAFRCEWLPESLRGWIEDIAERMQCPPDFPAAAAIVSLSSVIGTRIAMQPKALDAGWTEHPHLWGMIVGRPSLLKSPAMQAAMRPLRKMESEAFQRHEDGEQERAIAQLKAKLARKGKESKARTALGKGEEYDVSELLDDHRADSEPLRRFIVNNASIEALGEVMLANPTGTLLYQDELAGLLAQMEKEGNQGLRALCLTAWAGKEGYTFDRIGRGTRRVEKCALSILGAIQPAVLAARVRDAQRECAGNDGFMQRFSLLVWPDAPREWRNIDRAPSVEREEEALGLFQTLESLTVSNLQRLAPLNADGVPTFRFADDAQVGFDEWREGFEQRVRRDDIAPDMEAHLGKYRKLVPSLALLFHIAEMQGNGVSLEALEKALAWAGYLETHAARAYGSRAVASADGARRLLKRLLDGSAKLADDFTARDVRRKDWTALNTAEGAKAACDMLAEYGWLLSRNAGTTAQGGHPTTLFRLNPRAKTTPLPASEH